MPRRVILPAPDDIFRPTAVADLAPAPDPEPATRREASGRVKHDEKMTVYVTSDELFDLEHARLALRKNHRVSADRGRIVRAAIALALVDFDENGADSALVARLNEQ